MPLDTGKSYIFRFVTVPVDLRDILILVGIGNGFLMSLFMLFGQERTLARTLLGFLIFCLSFNVLVFIILKYRIYDQYPILHGLPFGLSFIIGPLIYFYVRAVVSKSFRLSRQHYHHFLWLILDYPHSVYHIIYGRSIPHLSLHYVLDKFALFSMFSNGVYLYLTFRFIKDYHRILPNFLSNTQNLQLKWLSDSILVWTALFFFGLVYGALDFVVDLNFEDAYLINYLFISSAIWLGFKGIKQGQNSIEITKQPAQSVSQEASAEIIQKLKKVMEEQKLYLMSDLTLRNVEDQLGYSSKEISHAINQSLKKNFYQFVNEYRVDAFKQKVLDPSKAHLTLLGIAQECGFSSKATFNRVFKSISGMSPKEYLTQHPGKRSH